MAGAGWARRTANVDSGANDIAMRSATPGTAAGMKRRPHHIRYGELLAWNRNSTRKTREAPTTSTRAAFHRAQITHSRPINASTIPGQEKNHANRCSDRSS